MKKLTLLLLVAVIFTVVSGCMWHHKCCNPDSKPTPDCKPNCRPDCKEGSKPETK